MPRARGTAPPTSPRSYCAPCPAHAVAGAAGATAGAAAGVAARRSSGRSSRGSSRTAGAAARQEQPREQPQEQPQEQRQEQPQPLAAPRRAAPRRAGTYHRPHEPQHVPTTAAPASTRSATKVLLGVRIAACPRAAFPPRIREPQLCQWQRLTWATCPPTPRKAAPCVACRPSSAAASSRLLRRLPTRGPSRQAPSRPLLSWRAAPPRPPPGPRARRANSKPSSSRNFLTPANPSASPLPRQPLFRSAEPGPLPPSFISHCARSPPHQTLIKELSPS
jgi:hypothetical protein